MAHARALLAKMGLAGTEDNGALRAVGRPCSSAWPSPARLRSTPTCCSSTSLRARSIPELTQDVLKVIRDLAAEHMTMVIVTHEMSFARDVADHIVFMDGGVIVEEGPAEQLINRPQHQRTRAFLAKYEGE